MQNDKGENSALRISVSYILDQVYTLVPILNGPLSPRPEALNPGNRRRWDANFAEMESGSEEGSYSRLIDVCITQL